MPCAFFRFSFFLIPPTFDGERDVRAALPFFSLLLLRTLDTALIRRMRSSSASNGSALAIESICSNRSDMSAAAVAGASCVFPGPDEPSLSSGTHPHYTRFRASKPTDDDDRAPSAPNPIP